MFCNPSTAFTTAETTTSLEHFADSNSLGIWCESNRSTLAADMHSLQQFLVYLSHSIIDALILSKSFDSLTRFTPHVEQRTLLGWLRVLSNSNNGRCLSLLFWYLTIYSLWRERWLILWSPATHKTLSISEMVLVCSVVCKTNTAVFGKSVIQSSKSTGHIQLIASSSFIAGVHSPLTW